MPFRLCNALSTFQSYINKLLREYLNEFCTAYLDNILIYSTKEKDYADQMLQMLKRLHKQKLWINIDKCKFLTKQVKYLGMIVTTEGIEIDKKK